VVSDPRGEILLGEIARGEALDHPRRLIVGRPDPRVAVTAERSLIAR
jgi:hypothetical protein